MRKILTLTLLVTITPLLFLGCASKDPLTECDKLKPTYEEVKVYGKVINAYGLAKMKKQDECRERVRGWK